MLPTGLFSAQSAPANPQAPQTTFRSSVELVTVTVSVRDQRGRVVQGLTRKDFTVIDSGERVDIRDFYSGDSPISLAILLDISGSMSVGGNIDRAREAVNVAAKSLRSSTDEAALFTFDSGLAEVVSFTRDLERVRRYVEIVRELCDGRPFHDRERHLGLGRRLRLAGQHAGFGTIVILHVVLSVSV